MIKDRLTKPKPRRISPVAIRAAKIEKRDDCDKLTARIRAEQELTGERKLRAWEYAPDKIDALVNAKLATPHRVEGRASAREIKSANRADLRAAQLSFI